MSLKSRKQVKMNKKVENQLSKRKPFENLTNTRSGKLRLLSYDKRKKTIRAFGSREKKP
jgi:hypothetical protein